MKKIIFAIFVLISFNLTAQWEITNEGFSVNSIDFINEEIGWLAGYSGTLLRTFDGGENWNSISIDESWNLNQIDFITETIGWAIGMSGDNAIIVKTVNGGYSWEVQKQIYDIHLNSIYIIDEYFVYAVGNDGIILSSSDGGENWTLIPTYGQDYRFISALFFNPLVGVITGSKNYNGTSAGIILRTSDGGINWQEKIIPSFRSVYDIQYQNDSTIYFIANYELGKLLCETADTCDSWIWRMNYPQISCYQLSDINSIFLVLKNSDDESYLIKSSDGGVHWQNIYSFENWGSNFTIKDILINNPNIGFAIINLGYGRSLIKSIDGGIEWELNTLSYPLNNAFFFNPNKGFISGGGCAGFVHCNLFGHIFSANDYGRALNLNISTNGIVNKIIFIDDFIGYALTDNEIFKSSNSGNDWSIVYENNLFSSDFFNGNDIWFESEAIGWAVGKYSDSLSYGAGILATINGGGNWNLGWQLTDSSGSSIEVYSIHFVGSTGWTVGDAGMIVKYTPQTGWVKQSSITGLPLNKVFFSDDNHGWIAGGYQNDNGFQKILLKTTDGGANWLSVPNVPYLIKDIAFIDNNFGWAIGYTETGEGGILETIDGGITWNIDTGNLPAQLNALHIKDNYAWAVGDNGLILRTTDAGAVWVEDEGRNKYPTEFTLEQNYPNPFNPSTVISYQLPFAGKVILKVYDVLGREVNILVNEEQPQGVYEVEFKPESIIKYPASGVYLYRLTAGSYSATKKMILLK